MHLRLTRSKCICNIIAIDYADGCIHCHSVPKATLISHSGCLAIAQLVKSLAASTHVNSRVQAVLGSEPGAGIPLGIPPLRVVASSVVTCIQWMTAVPGYGGSCMQALRCTVAP